MPAWKRSACSWSRNSRQKKTIVQERDALEVRCNKMKSKLQSILAEDEVTTPAAAPTPVAAPASNPVGG